MTCIRVNPGSLQQSSGEVKTIAGDVRKTGDDLWRSAGSAPSYDGQFGPKVRTIARAALARAQKHDARMNTLSGSLSGRAAAFQAADTAGLMGLRANPVSSIFADPALLRLLAGLMGLPIAQINRLLQLGQLGSLRMPWNPAPAYADDGSASSVTENSKPALMGVIWGWISGAWNKLFGKEEKSKLGEISESKKTITSEENGFVEKIDQTEPEPQRSLDGIALRQSDYTDQMGDNGLTIKDAGCLITCIAMIGRYYGADVSPQDVNNYIKENGGYAAGTSNFPGWGLGKKFLTSVTGKSVSYESVSNADVTETIKNGDPMIIHVKNYYHDKPETSDGHWVVAVGIDDNGDYICLDAATGKQRIYPKNRLHSKSNSIVYGTN